MADKPILFSDPMVRAIVEGRKTQTRRVLKPQPQVFRNAGPFYQPAAHVSPREWHCCLGNTIHAIINVPYAAGDRLWVKESWRTRCDGDPLPPREMYPEHYPIFYNCDRHGRLRPSIFMPRWASRITLLVTDVRVQRLQDISEEDAMAEGIIQENVNVDCHCAGGIHQEVVEDRFFGRDDDEEGFEDAGSAFADLWEGLNAKRGFGWEINPWVAAISFKPFLCNIDQMEKSNASD